MLKEKLSKAKYALYYSDTDIRLRSLITTRLILDTCQLRIFAAIAMVSISLLESQYK